MSLSKAKYFLLINFCHNQYRIFEKFVNHWLYKVLCSVVIWNRAGAAVLRSLRFRINRRVNKQMNDIFFTTNTINFIVLFFILLSWHYFLTLQLHFKMSGRERKIAIMGYRSVGKLFSNIFLNELYVIHGKGTWFVEKFI